MQNVGSSNCSMGHSDIGVTLNAYTHIGYDDAKEKLERMAKAE